MGYFGGGDTGGWTDFYAAPAPAESPATQTSFAPTEHVQTYQPQTALGSSESTAGSLASPVAAPAAQSFATDTGGFTGAQYNPSYNQSFTPGFGATSYQGAPAGDTGSLMNYFGIPQAGEVTAPTSQSPQTVAPLPTGGRDVAPGAISAPAKGLGGASANAGPGSDNLDVTKDKANLQSVDTIPSSSASDVTGTDTAALSKDFLKGLKSTDVSGLNSSSLSGSAAPGGLSGGAPVGPPTSLGSDLTLNPSAAPSTQQTAATAEKAPDLAGMGFGADGATSSADNLTKTTDLPAATGNFKGMDANSSFEQPAPHGSPPGDKSVGQQVKDATGFSAADLAKGLAGLGSMAGSISSGNKPLQGQQQLQGTADTASAISNNLLSAYKAGTLPPGMQQQFNTQAAAAKASIRNQYARMGMSGSSSEQSALAAVDNQIAGQAGNMLQTMLSQALSANQQAGGQYQTILTNSMAQDKAMTDAFSKFAASLV